MDAWVLRAVTNDYGDPWPPHSRVTTFVKTWLWHHRASERAGPVSALAVA